MARRSTALVKKHDYNLIPAEPLKAEDLTDGSIPELHRALALRVPAAVTVNAALKSINGRPIGNRVLVLPLPPNDRFGSIIIPENAREEQISGIVVAVGKGRYDNNGNLVPVEVIPGNYVMFSKYAARKIRVADIEVFQIVETDITFAAGTEAELHADSSR